MMIVLFKTEVYFWHFLAVAPICETIFSPWNIGHQVWSVGEWKEKFHNRKETGKLLTLSLQWRLYYLWKMMIANNLARREINSVCCNELWDGRREAFRAKWKIRATSSLIAHERFCNFFVMVRMFSCILKYVVFPATLCQLAELHLNPGLGSGTPFSPGLQSLW